MKNTITLGIDINTLIQEIHAECTWVDSSNIAVLPPIVNPVKNETANIIDVIMESMNTIISKLSGYITNHTFSDIICKIDIYCHGISTQNQSSLRTNVEKYLRFSSLYSLYLHQQQAKHIANIYLTKRDNAMKSIKQLLATMQ